MGSCRLLLDSARMTQIGPPRVFMGAILWLDDLDDKFLRDFIFEEFDFSSAFKCGGFSCNFHPGCYWMILE